MFSTPTTATAAAPANLPSSKLDTNQQTRPLPYWFGRRWFAVTWCVSHVYNYKETKKSSGGKSAKSGGGSQSTVTCDVAGLVACGLADYIEAIEVNGAIAWSSGTLTRGTAHPEHTGDIAIANVGTFRLHWGTETAAGDFLVLNSGDETHPYYRGKIVLEAKSLNCGSGGSIPNIRVLLERAPRFAGLLDENRTAEGANPVTALAEILENDFFGCGLSGITDVATAALLANAVRSRTKTVATPNDPSHLASMGYLSGYVEELRSMSDVLASVLENFDGWVRRKGESLEIGQFTHGAIDTSGLLEITLHDFVDEPQFPNPSVDNADVITDAIVTGPDRDIMMQDSWQSGPNPVARDRLKAIRTKTFARPFLCTSYQQKEMADFLVSFYSLAAPDCQQRVRRARLGATRPGDRVIVNYSPDSSRLVYRVTARSDPAKGGAVDLTLQRERGLGALPYIAAPDPAPALPSPNIPAAIAAGRIFQVPGAWAGSPAPMVIPLAGRPSAVTRGFRPWFSTAGTTYDQLADTIDWAIHGTLAAATGTTDASLTVTVAAGEDLDLALLADQSAAAQADDTLLLFIGAEVLSIGDVTAIGGGQYTLAVLRGRRGSAAASHGSGSDIYVLPRSECLLLDHAQFPRTAATQYFKLQSHSAAQDQNLGSALAIAFTFANTATNPATSFVAAAVTEAASLTWTNPADPDLDHAAIYVKAHGEPAPAIGDTPTLTWPVISGAGSKCPVPGLTAGAAYDFYVCLYDSASYPSAMVGPASCTPLAAPTGPTGSSAYPLLVQYSVDGSTSWHSTPGSGDYYLRTSSDNGATWSAAAKFRGADGSPGTSAYNLQVQYSVDGSTSWHSTPASNDVYIRTSTDGGATWSAAAKFRGSDGTSAPAPQFRYSADGVSFHGTATSGDKYMQASTDGGTTWGGTLTIRGNDGNPGTAGTAGGFLDYVFQRAASQPATPTGNGTPAGWSDAPPTGSNPLWTSTASKNADDTLASGASWSTPIRLDGAAGTSASNLQVQYSVDGSTSWHTTPTTSDVYMRTSSDGGSTWTGALKIKGENGTSAPQVQFQYSTDNASWHSTFATGDLYLRTSNDGGSTWSAGQRFVGTTVSTAPDAVLGNAGTSPYKISIAKPTGAPTGYSVTYSQGGGALATITSWPLAAPLTMSSQTQSLYIRASASGCLDGSPINTSWADQFL